MTHDELRDALVNEILELQVHLPPDEIEEAGGELMLTEAGGEVFFNGLRTADAVYTLEDHSAWRYRREGNREEITQFRGGELVFQKILPVPGAAANN